MSEPKALLKIRDINAWFGDKHVLKGPSLDAFENEVLALIGPSGCGKSTFIRTINRLHEEVPGARVSGTIEFDGENIYDPGVDVVNVRKKIGMVFQKPNPFPGMSIFDNVSAGLRLQGIRRRSKLAEIVESSLKKAALWDEVKDQLNKPGVGLSGGQQQRLCLARTLAVDPPVILMDEPTSALDPISTAKIEELIMELKADYTVVIVTHNMQQAARISNKTAFFLLGEVIEHDKTSRLFTNPSDKRTEEYITGRFG